MNKTLGELATRMGGTLHGVDPGTLATGWATDNRKVKPGDVFLCIRGARVDGHVFAAGAVKAGAIAVVAEREVPEPHILVPEVVPALAKLAGGIRKEYTGPVIGITGSAGKTTAKELIAAALSDLGPILKTQGNQNSEFTSPLLWTELDGHAAVVVEMAMRGFGQIAHLAAFSKPTIGVITNIGWSHLEMVDSRLGIARAKAELLEALPKKAPAILWAEDDFFNDLRQVHQPVISFGFSERADVRILTYEPHATGARITGTAMGEAWAADLPLLGRHLALNAAAAIAAATQAGVSAARAAELLANVELPPMRMEMKEVGGVTYLIDTYNAAPPSTIAALETLADVPAKRRFAVLGQMNELGKESDLGHRIVGDRLASLPYDEVLVFGSKAKPIIQGANEAGYEAIRSVGSLEEIQAFLLALQPGDAVVLKGSRSLELEKALPEAVR